MDTLRADLDSAERIMSRVPDHECSTPLQSLCVQSYYLLSHAAFESFIEDMGLKTIDKAVDDFKNDGTISKTLVSLVTANIIEQISLRSKRQLEEKIVREFDVAVTEAKRSYGRLVVGNHGVKKENQKNLLIPAGVDPEIEDVSTFNNLHTFGIERGSIAHNFSSIRTEHTKSSLLSKKRELLLGLEKYALALEAAVCTRMLA